MVTKNNFSVVSINANNHLVVNVIKRTEKESEKWKEKEGKKMI